MVIVTVLGQPVESKMLTVYVVVVSGVTVGLNEFGLLTPDAGDHVTVKVESVIACSIVVCPDETVSSSAVAANGNNVGSII